MDKPSNYDVILSEFLGTFILSTAISFSSVYTDSQSGNLFAIFAGFFMAITITREISGGHINPGVTLTILLSTEDFESKKKKSRQAVFYVLAQLLGGFVSPILCYLLYNKNMFELSINPSSNSLKALLIEIIGSFIFYTTILIQGDPNAKLNTQEKTLSTLTIGFGLLAGIAASCNISGGGLNPALALGFQLSRSIIFMDIGNLNYTWLYIVGPFIASYLSSLFYHSIQNSFDSEKYGKSHEITQN